MSRETIMEALLAQVTSGGAFITTGRRLLHWTKVAAQPALFLRHVTDEYPPRPTGIPAKVVMECEVWIYSQGGADPDVAPDVAMNDLLDALEQSLSPPPAFRTQTLGGLVRHAWIEGKIEVHPGDLDGQAIAVVPIRILVPSINAT